MQYQEQSSQFYGARCDDNGSWVREDLLAAGAASISPVLLAASKVPVHDASRGPAARTPVWVKQPSSGRPQLSAHCIQRALEGTIHPARRVPVPKKPCRVRRRTGALQGNIAGMGPRPAGEKDRGACFPLMRVHGPREILGSLGSFVRAVRRYGMGWEWDGNG